MLNDQKNIEEQLQLQQQILALENIAKECLSKEALGRYFNIKTAHPQLAIQITTFLAQAYQTGNLKEKISDESFKKILQEIQQTQKKEFKFIRK